MRAKSKKETDFLSVQRQEKGQTDRSRLGKFRQGVRPEKICEANEDLVSNVTSIIVKFAVKNG